MSEALLALEYLEKAVKLASEIHRVINSFRDAKKNHEELAVAGVHISRVSLMTQLQVVGRLVKKGQIDSETAQNFLKVIQRRYENLADTKAYLEKHNSQEYSKRLWWAVRAETRVREQVIEIQREMYGINSILTLSQALRGSTPDQIPVHQLSVIREREYLGNNIYIFDISYNLEDSSNRPKNSQEGLALAQKIVDEDIAESDRADTSSVQRAERISRILPRRPWGPDVITGY